MADKKETSVVPASANQVGKLNSDAAFSDFVGEGFATVETVVFGAETDQGGNRTGKCSRYVGLLIGEGAPITREDRKTGEVQTQKTFAFHPIGRINGTLQPVESVTHVIPASYMMAAGLDRIVTVAKEKNQRAIVGMLYRGQVDTRNGYRVNDIGIFEKYI